MHKGEVRYASRKHSRVVKETRKGLIKINVLEAKANTFNFIGGLVFFK